MFSGTSGPGRHVWSLKLSNSPENKQYLLRPIHIFCHLKNPEHHPGQAPDERQVFTLTIMFFILKDAQVAIDVDNCVPDFENLSRIREKGTRVASSGRLKCSHAAPASLLWHNLFLWLDFNSFFLWSDKQFFEVLLLAPQAL